jgi:hypothetical protein
MFLNGFALREEPCMDPYARFCGQTEAAASSDPISEPQSKLFVGQAQPVQRWSKNTEK